MLNLWQSAVMAVVLNTMSGVFANTNATNSPYTTYGVVPDVIPVAPTEVLSVSIYTDLKHFHTCKTVRASTTRKREKRVSDDMIKIKYLF